MALDRNEILNVIKTLPSFMQSPTKSAMPNSNDRCATCWESLRQSGSTPGLNVPKYLDEYGDSDWAGDEEWKTLDHWSCNDFRSSSRKTLRWRRNRWSRCPARRRSSTLATERTASGL